jgi:hypothetical protein
MMPGRSFPSHAVLVAAIIAYGAHAAPVISPAAGSDAVLSLRAEAQPELRLVYKVERAGAPTESITVGLAADYDYKLSPSTGLWINDYRLKRWFRVPKEGGLLNDSLYAGAWYRGAELDNRANINAAMNKAGLDTRKGLLAQDPYWAETELGATTSKFPRPDLRRAQVADRLSWSLGKDEVAAVRYRNEPVPASLRGGLRRWWPSITAIHPVIADELAQSGKVAAELWVKELVQGKTLETSHWTLSEAQLLETAKYPLHPGLASVPTQPRGTYPRIFELLSQEIAEKRSPPPQETYFASAQAAIAHNAGLEAILWVVEMQLAAGVEAPCSTPSETDHCALAARAGPIAKMDPRTAIAFATQSPDAGARAQFDSLPNAYLLRLLWATRPPGKDVKRNDVEEDLLAALKTRAIANFCKDTGDFYARAWEPFAAWQVWDLGRLLPNHRSGDLLDQIDKLEAEVARQTPALF